MAGLKAAKVRKNGCRAFAIFQATIDKKNDGEVRLCFIESLASFSFKLWSRLSKPYLRLWLLFMENEAQGINSDGKEVLSLSTGTARVMEMSWIHPKLAIVMDGHRLGTKINFIESLASFSFKLWSRLSKPYLRLWLLFMENEAQGINSDGKEVLSLSTGTARVMEMSWIHPKLAIVMDGHRLGTKINFIESLASFSFKLWSRLSKPYLRLWLLFMENEAQGINSDGKEVLSLSTGTARVMEMSWIHPKLAIVMDGHRLGTKINFIESLASFSFKLWSRLSKPYLRLWLLFMENEAQGINSDGKEVLSLSTGTARVMEMSWIHPKLAIVMDGHRLGTKINWEQTRPTSDLQFSQLMLEFCGS